MVDWSVYMLDNSFYLWVCLVYMSFWKCPPCPLSETACHHAGGLSRYNIETIWGLEHSLCRLYKRTSLTCKLWRVPFKNPAKNSEIKGSMEKLSVGWQPVNLYASSYKLDVCLSVHRCICVEKKTQLDVTEYFIALMTCSTCFGHFYAHHQELETTCVLLPPMVCSAVRAKRYN